MQLYAKYGGTKRAQCAPIPQTGFEEKVHTPCEQSFWPRTGAGKKLLQVVAVLCRGRNLLLIGIILCAEKDHIDVELALQDVRKPIAVSDYDLIVPRRELQQLVQEELELAQLPRPESVCVTKTIRTLDASRHRKTVAKHD